jgi:hypothetical protein
MVTDVKHRHYKSYAVEARSSGPQPRHFGVEFVINAIWRLWIY